MAASDSFIVSTYAAWAGDVSYEQKLAERIAPSLDEDIEGPLYLLMREVAAVRLERLQDRLDVSREDRAPDPVVLTSSHLRGVLWRLEEREFLLRAYLTDLEWQDKLFARAMAHQAAAPAARHVAEPDEADKPDAFTEGRKTYGPLGASWVVAGNPFIRVELSDIGLLEARGLWTSPALVASDGHLILEAFRKLLIGLDRSAVPGEKRTK